MTDVEALQRTVRRSTALLAALVCMAIAGTQSSLPAFTAPLVFFTFLGSILYLVGSVLSVGSDPTPAAGDD
jgi:hypothetical protein